MNRDDYTTSTARGAIVGAAGIGGFLYRYTPRQVGTPTTSGADRHNPEHAMLLRLALQR